MADVRAVDSEVCPMSKMMTLRQAASAQDDVPRPEGRIEPPSTRVWIFVGLWVLSLVVTAGLVLSNRSAGQPSEATGALAFLPLLAATVALVRALGPGPTGDLAAAPVTRRGRLILAIVAVVIVLFPSGVAGPVVLIPLAAAAAVVLLVLRPGVSARGWVTALVLGAIAALGGLLDWTAKGGLNNLVWALAQLPLVLLTLLAGWAIVGRAGWEPVGIGRTIVLDGRVRPALRGFLFGAFLAIPWALGNIVNGPFEGDVYRTFWQPLAAFHPGVAEEAWGRMFLIPALYLLFRNFATARTALVTAVVLGTFWFAFLHFPANPVATLLVGGIFMLPMTYLWLRRGLEVAIGFHVCVDLVRFFAAYLAFKGLWFV